MNTVADCNRLILGTAQLGMPYGVANKIGKPDRAGAEKIVKTALDRGISHFDTAQDYGESEALLGDILNVLNAAARVEITTKLNPSINPLNEKEVINAVKRSLSALKIPRLYCLMLHREEQLAFMENGLDAILLKIKNNGYAMHVGVSVYSPDKAVEALMMPAIDIVQLPTNILDRRFEKAGIFEKAAALGKTVHIRSVFLQGLLLMEPKDIPGKMVYAVPVVSRLEEFAKEINVTRTALALHYVKMKYPSAKVLFGAESEKQVRDNCDIWRTDAPNGIVEKSEQLFSSVDERILNPTLWN